MLLSIAQAALGFLGGVFITGVLAVYVFGLLHAEAIAAVEGRGNMLFFPNAFGAKPRGLKKGGR